jgi:HEAT repeat protein
MPLLREAHESAKTQKDKLAFARVLGMLGDGTGTGTLIAAIRAQAWDKGWNFRGMGQFGRSLSLLDSLIIALGRTRDKRAVEPILEKLNGLDAKKAFSHHRAVAMALEALADPAAAKPLADLLRKPQMTGHARATVQSAIETPRARNSSLRELVVARALYRCGDHEGLGEKILQAYARDLRGHFSRHARAVLGEPKRAGEKR